MPSPGMGTMCSPYASCITPATLTATSRPTSSSSVTGPTGNPHRTAILATPSIDAPPARTSPTPLQSIIENPARSESALAHAGHVGVLHAHVDFGLRHRGAGDAGAHEARTDNAKSLDTHRRRRVRDAGIFLELIRRKKDLDQFAGDIGHRELSEQLRLAFQAFGDAVLQSVLYRLERGQRCGVVSTGPLEHQFARAAEREPPAERIAVEQKSEKAAGALAFGAPVARHALRGGQRDVGEDRR